MLQVFTLCDHSGDHNIIKLKFAVNFIISRNCSALFSFLPQCFNYWNDYYLQKCDTRAQTCHISFLAFLFHHILQFICLKIPFTKSKYLFSNQDFAYFIKTIMTSEKI